MNELGLALAWSAVQVTMLTSATLIIERWASRRGPKAGAWVAGTAIWLVIVLSPLPFLDPLLRSGWQIAVNRGLTAPGLVEIAQRSGPAHLVPESDDTDHAQEHGSSSHVLVPLSWLQRVRDSLARQADTIREGRPAWARASVYLLLAGTAWCLLRLLIGLAGVRECRRRSIPVADRELLREMASLRVALRITRDVEVRELPKLLTATAAAVGWWRPLILLPGNWRTWNESERLAVLAHELAHIARADYATGIVARLGLTLHFYHPLVHWLVSRLRLQQELAADADGARLAGGRRSYLTSLSRLALRQEGSPPAWPAQAFLTSDGHLIRRIHVLKAKVAEKDGSLSRTARAVTIASLLAVGMVTAALRGPSSSRGAEPPPDSVTEAAKPVAGSTALTDPEPFDLSFIPAKAQGFVAVRPSAIFGLPGMKQQFETLNALIAKELPNPNLRIEDIEQATLGISITPRDRKSGQPGRLAIGPGMVRCKAAFDWKSLVRVFAKRFGPAGGELAEVPFEGQVYYKAAKIPAFGPGVFCFYFPDARTLVHLDEDAIRNLIRGGAGARPEYVRGADWHRVEKDLVVLAIDNKDLRWKLDVETDDPEDLLIAPLVQSATRCVFGVGGGDSSVVHAIATSGTEREGETVARTAEALLSRLKTAINTSKTNPPVGKETASREFQRIAMDLLQACKVRRDGAMVDLSVTSQLPVEQLITCLFAEAGL
jgi:BlaR1 peptidase M56